jgi:hypothetical protein
VSWRFAAEFLGTRALFAVQDNGWDHALTVTADGERPRRRGQLALVLEAAPSASTARHVLALASDQVLTRVA